MELKLRHQSYYNKENETSSSSVDLRTKLQLPNALISSLSSVQKKAFLGWKNATVNGDRVSNNEISELLRQADTPCDSRHKKKKKRKKSGAMK
eukprot:13742154-Ditylum_brightwellii.AAC.1